MNSDRLAVRSKKTSRRLSTSASPLITAIAALLIASPAYAITSPLISGHQIDSSDISAFTKWTELMPRYSMQHLTMEQECIGTDCVNRKWETLLRDLATKPAREQIEQVNSFFNTMAYVTDQQNYGISDYWQTPYELMERGGDCEDYAIAKYISLKRLGFDERQMRIIVVKDGNLNGTIHAVLEVQSGGETHILDNQEKSVLPVAQVLHYSPVFAINERSWWAYK